MKSTGSKLMPLIVFVIFVAAALGWMIVHQFQPTSGGGQTAAMARPVPVEVRAIKRGPIARNRTFSGELDAQAEFVVAPKVGGRVLRVMVNLADRVSRGQVVAELDNDEYVQAVAQAEADLEVARANLSQAKSALEIADREFNRTRSLLERGIASDSEFDAARQDQRAKDAQLKVADAQVKKAEASLETARIRLGYTQVTAGWTGGDATRVVAERYVDEGQTVAANTPLLTIVELNPIVGIFFVTEKEYAYLHPGQAVSMTTQAYPEESFEGRIERIAPVFRKSTRQARVEMHVDNPDHRLKPGMFIRVRVELERVADAVIVARQALTVRDDKDGIFIVREDGRSVGWHPVTVGVVAGDRVQVRGDGLTGLVVTLGQQLLSDGASITIPQPDMPAAGAGQGAALP
ncbi:efflux transporter, RND family, MFP subunit, related to HlyD [Desulfosarcina variabilis str. Montpellier]|uniref:efflux RND transporter periplasmic adaptor subunit n=1 Tax=Desulfosarcina variabilis TaxID=2300 RepID=UPI003AFA5F67